MVEEEQLAAQEALSVSNLKEKYLRSMKERETLQEHAAETAQQAHR